MRWEELQKITEEVRQTTRKRLTEEGICVPCWDGIMIAEGVRISQGTLLLPGTILLGSTTIGKDCVIGPGSVLEDTTVGNHVQLNNVHSEGAEVGDGCEIGPFVRLRRGTRLGQNLRIGNFVEIKNSSVGDGTKIAHLSYIGDADFGQGVNVGCGLAVANYDGAAKHRTTVGDGVFLGCHNSLVAPVALGDGAFTAAGSVITQNVPAGGFAIARARQLNKEKKTKG